MVTHLSQVVAVEKDTKEKAAQALAQAQRTFGNASVFAGIARSYTPKHDDGEKLPPESTRVRFKVRDVLGDVQARLADLFDVVATKDITNCSARVDLTIGDIAIKGVPTPTLLFLEKQLAELANFVKGIPVLDPAEDWHYDAGQDCYATPPAETIRTKKDKHFQQLFAGNEHHPPQFVALDEDIPQGTWQTIKYSGALPQKDVNAILSRIEQAQKAVKFAREEANRTVAQSQDVGKALLRYLLG